METVQKETPKVEKINSSSIENEIFGLEKKFWDAMKDGDTETMMDLSDDECILAGPQGVSKLKKTDFPEMMASDSYKLLYFSIDDDYQVTVINDEMAVIAYKVQEEMTVEGKPVQLEAADASTWVRRNGKWVCCMHTESIIGDPFGRDRNPEKLN